MIQGDEPGARWKLMETRVTTIGRSSRNQINFVSPTVSRYHCEISFINGLWHVTDLNSRKGTYVNGRRITQREVLKPGDNIRLSTNVFRFDLIDETATEDEAMVAIRDASLNVEAPSKRESVATLDEMRQRSQLYAAEEEGKERGWPKNVFLNVVFVGFVAAVVAVVVGVALVSAYSSKRRSQHEREHTVEEARQAYESAERVANSGSLQSLDAVAALNQVQERYPATAAAGEAAVLSQRMEGQALEYELGRIREAEGEGRYKDALDRTNRLLETLWDPAFKDFLETRKRYTEELARAGFRRTQTEALRLEEQKNDPEAAIALYALAIDRIGLPEVIEKAKAKISEIKERHPSVGETSP